MVNKFEESLCASKTLAMAALAATSSSAKPESKTVQRIVFFHPDLGIGGAERLIVDAAVGLQERGHKVTIFTSHCDPNHCFEEARDGTSDAVHTIVHLLNSQVILL